MLRVVALGELFAIQYNSGDDKGKAVGEGGKAEYTLEHEVSRNKNELS